MYKPTYLHFNILNYFHATNLMIYVVNHFFYGRTTTAIDEQQEQQQQQIFQHRLVYEYNA